LIIGVWLAVGKALLASCAYSGRVAVAYMSDYARPHPSDTSKQLINLFVRVYECESTGEILLIMTMYSMGAFILPIPSIMSAVVC